MRARRLLVWKSEPELVDFAEPVPRPGQVVVRIGGAGLRQGTEQLLLPLTRHLEYRGLDAMDPTVLLACFQRAPGYG
jgi:hypothetical protein